MVLRTSGRVGSRRFSFPGPFRVGDFFCLLAMPFPLFFRSRPFSGPVLPVLLSHLSCLTAVCLYSAYQGWSSPVCKEENPESGLLYSLIPSDAWFPAAVLSSFCRICGNLQRVRIMAYPVVVDMCMHPLLLKACSSVLRLSFMFLAFLSYILIREWKNSRIAWYILWILNLFFSYMCFYSPIL